MTTDEALRHTAPTGARCAQHPETAARAACERCGDFCCTVCFVPEDARCKRCSVAGIKPVVLPDGSVMIPVPGLGERLTLRPSLVSGPKLFLDGQRPKREKRFYLIQQPDGPELRMRLKPRFVDPYPRLFIDDVEITIVEALPALAVLWVCVPLLLVFCGGCVGVVIGALATTANYKLMRSARPALTRYLMVGAVNMLTIGVVLVLAIAGRIAPR